MPPRVSGETPDSLSSPPPMPMHSLARLRRPRRLLVACATLVFGLNGSVASAQSYSWKNVQIRGGGYISGLSFHPTAANLLYARTDVGGIYRWNESNSTWIPLNDTYSIAESQLAGVVSLALDPNDANRVYIACGQYLQSWGRNGAILRSADRGATWSRTELNVASVGATVRLGGNADGRNTGERLAVDPNLGTVLLLGTNQDGLWKSVDRGVTWTRLTSFTPTSTTFVAFDKGGATVGGASQVIYVGVNTTTGPSLYKSTNGGTTWAPVSGGPAVGTLPATAVFDGSRVLYLTYANALGLGGTTDGSVWKLTSAGAWTNITPLAPLTQSGDRFSYAGITVKGSGATATVYVTSLNRYNYGDEIWRSSAAGAPNSWTALGAIDTYSAPDAPWVFFHRAATSQRPNWTTTIALDPASGSNRVFFGTGGGVWASSNASGSSVAWTFRNAGLEETVPRELVSPPSGAPLLSALADIGGFRHDSLTASPPDANFWNPVGGGNSSIDFAEANPGVVVRNHSSAPYGARSTNGGTTWTNFGGTPAPVTSGSMIGLIAINANASRIVWNPADSVPYYSIDNGQTWTASTGVPVGSNLPVADRVNPNKFYVFNNGSVYVSTNGGSAFSVGKTGLPTGAGRMRAVVGREGDLWLPTGSGLYHSIDSGQNFALVTGVTSASQIGLGIAAPGMTYPALYVYGVVGAIEGVHRSTDAGSTWLRVDDDAHRYGWLNTIIGDARTFGRVYLGTGGRGIIYGEAPAGLVANGVFKVVSVASGKALDVSGWGTADGSNVGQWTYGGGTNQRWAFTHLAANRYRITGVHSAKPLTDASSDADVNADIAGPVANNNQVWVVSAATGGFHLTNLATGRRLEVDSATGALVIQSAASTSTKQIWSVLAP